MRHANTPTSVAKGVEQSDRGPEPDGGYANVSRHRRGDVLARTALPDLTIPAEAMLGPDPDSDPA